MVKYFSVYNANSSIEASLTRSHSRRLREIPRPTNLHGLEARTAGTQIKLTTISTKHLSPEERSLRKLRSKQRRQKTIFQIFSEVDFLHSRRFQRRNARDGVCYVPRGSSQPIVLPS